MIADVKSDAVERTVRSQFATMVDVPADQLDMDANLFEAYGLDSIKALKLISDVEVEFDIDIEQEEARDICTLNNMIALIREKSNVA